MAGGRSRAESMSRALLEVEGTRAGRENGKSIAGMGATNGRRSTPWAHSRVTLAMLWLWSGSTIPTTLPRLPFRVMLAL